MIILNSERFAFSFEVRTLIDLTDICLSSQSKYVSRYKKWTKLEELFRELAPFSERYSAYLPNEMTVELNRKVTQICDYAWSRQITPVKWVLKSIRWSLKQLYIATHASPIDALPPDLIGSQILSHLNIPDIGRLARVSPLMHNITKVFFERQIEFIAFFLTIKSNRTIEENLTTHTTLRNYKANIIMYKQLNLNLIEENPFKIFNPFPINPFSQTIRKTTELFIAMFFGSNLEDYANLRNDTKIMHGNKLAVCYEYHRQLIENGFFNIALASTRSIQKIERRINIQSDLATKCVEQEQNDAAEMFASEAFENYKLFKKTTNAQGKIGGFDDTLLESFKKLIWTDYDIKLLSEMDRLDDSNLDSLDRSHPKKALQIGGLFKKFQKKIKLSHELYLASHIKEACELSEDALEQYLAENFDKQIIGNTRAMVFDNYITNSSFFSQPHFHMAMYQPCDSSDDCEDFNSFSTTYHFRLFYFLNKYLGDLLSNDHPSCRFLLKKYEFLFPNFNKKINLDVIIMDEKVFHIPLMRKKKKYDVLKELIDYCLDHEQIEQAAKLIDDMTKISIFWDSSASPSLHFIKNDNLKNIKHLESFSKKQDKEYINFLYKFKKNYNEKELSEKIASLIEYNRKWRLEQVQTSFRFGRLEIGRYLIEKYDDTLDFSEITTDESDDTSDTSPFIPKIISLNFVDSLNSVFYRDEMLRAKENGYVEIVKYLLSLQLPNQETLSTTVYDNFFTALSISDHDWISKCYAVFPDFKERMLKENPLELFNSLALSGDLRMLYEEWDKYISTQNLNATDSCSILKCSIRSKNLDMIRYWMDVQHLQPSNLKEKNELLEVIIRENDLAILRFFLEEKGWGDYAETYGKKKNRFPFQTLLEEFCGTQKYRITAYLFSRVSNDPEKKELLKTVSEQGRMALEQSNLRSLLQTKLKEKFSWSNVNCHRKALRKKLLRALEKRMTIALSSSKLTVNAPHKV